MQKSTHVNVLKITPIPPFRNYHKFEKYTISFTTHLICFPSEGCHGSDYSHFDIRKSRLGGFR